jgi:hypothetical protein
MPERSELARWIRERADRLREIASTQTPFSPELMRMARETDEEANRLDAASDYRSPIPSFTARSFKGRCGRPSETGRAPIRLSIYSSTQMSAASISPPIWF